MHDFLAMGGYARFVWPAYGFAALVLLAMGLRGRMRLRRAEAQLRRLEADLAAQRAGAEAGER